MRPASFFFLSLLFLFPANILTAQARVDVLHYSFDITLSDHSDSIHGKATVQLRYLVPASSVAFDLVTTRPNGKGMTVSGVTGKNVKEFSKDADHLNVQLLQPAAANDTASYTITYAGIPADGLIISTTKYGHRSFFADNWPNRGHNWIPCIDEPGDKAPVEFIVTAPEHYQVIANGIKVEETDMPGNTKLTHWKEDVPISTKVMVIGAADFAVSLSGMIDGCIPVYSWVYPENRNEGFYDYAQAATILPFYIKYVGPYGYKKLANVQSKTRFGGLENANTIFYAENSVTGTRKSETLLAHEIAHQWFGNMATEKTFAHLWLSEGFATYMTILYMENKYGIDTARAMLKEDRAQAAEFARNTDRPVVDDTQDYMQLLNANSYQKGGWILHMLRRQLGDTVFQRSVRSYYATYAGKNADSKDLETIFEKVSGKDLTVFFRQWLYTGGIPRLNVKWSNAGAKLTLEIKQLQKSPFQFPLEINAITVSGKTITQTINVTTATQTFLLPVKEKISSIQLDPKVSLLFEGTLSEQK